ncbi:uncharacterized protein LOC132572084 [Heteronotia binoei]|uniref:uncharacterized protein LOC132572084 n=1 Tax=Heteronotia binoei TaxID=13085 RepID=UPI00292E208A|nr:uncharacterized protein LOC132572084 [Heteronotia binoei]
MAGPACRSPRARGPGRSGRAWPRAPFPAVGSRCPAPPPRKEKRASACPAPPLWLIPPGPTRQGWAWSPAPRAAPPSSARPA